MKKTTIIFIVGLLSLSLAMGQTDSTEYKNIYVVLDRNSPNIKFKEMTKRDNSRSMLLYSMNTNIKDFIYEIIFANAYEPLLDRTDEMKKIPVSFIDSIAYMDEKYIKEATQIYRHEFQWEKIQDKKIYLIDIGTIENDSVMMYEVGVRFDGFKE